MNRAKTRKINPWLRISQYLFWGLLLIFIIISFIDPSSAASPGAGATSFNDLMLVLQGVVGGIIGLLAVFMVIAGGIVYATSQGNSGQMGLGKEIIVSAIGGLLLFMFALWFLGSNLGGGIISKFFPVPEIESTSPAPSSRIQEQSDEEFDDAWDDQFGGGFWKWWDW